jgi:hypothetical protein
MPFFEQPNFDDNYDNGPITLSTFSDAIVKSGRFIYRLENGDVHRYDTYTNEWVKVASFGKEPPRESEQLNQPNTQVVDFRKLDVD